MTEAPATTAEPTGIPDLGRPVRASVEALTLNNFKSFAEKTTIALREGLTTVSGPTGSGKSNVIDAVQFVLGIATLQGMRAERLTDLICTDGGKRVARVSLIIDGTFEQKDGRRVQRRLEITRVLRRVRSGAQAHYELDGRAVSPVGLHDLMRGLGFPTSGQNVVLHGDVMRLASMGGVALRLVLDELAGARDFDNRIALAHEKSMVATLDTEKTQARERIVDLEREKRCVFLEAFERVSKAFSGTFAELARGDGRLRLESPEDPFAGGLIIEASMRGKTLKPLESMSGREKSLAALTYVLALHEVNPAPLFVIDDQNLDGVNTEVLLKTIHTRAGGRQSLVMLRDRGRSTVGVTMRKGSGMVVTSVGARQEGSP